WSLSSSSCRCLRLSQAPPGKSKSQVFHGHQSEIRAFAGMTRWIGEGSKHLSNFHTRLDVIMVRPKSPPEQFMTRLSQKNLASLAKGIAVPGYDRSKVTAGIVHLGIGAFHRAHMAVYVDDILSRDPTWGIVGASLRRPDTKEALEPQDGL